MVGWSVSLSNTIVVAHFAMASAASQCGSTRVTDPQCMNKGHQLGESFVTVSREPSNPSSGDRMNQQVPFLFPQALPQFPGEDCLKHQADLWIETVETRLAGINLLSVARGGQTPEYHEVKDTTPLPELPPSHPHYEKRLEHRHRVAHDNDINAQRRYVIEMKAWTRLYDALHTSVASTSPMLAKEMHTLCDISHKHGASGAYFDGPLAWNIIIKVLTGVERTKADKRYYELAEELQRKHHLIDGCSAAEYSAKAQSFIAHILPNLARQFSPTDAGDYLIDLMPTSLRESGRRNATNWSKTASFMSTSTSLGSAAHSSLKNKSNHPFNRRSSP